MEKIVYPSKPVTYVVGQQNGHLHGHYITSGGLHLPDFLLCRRVIAKPGLSMSISSKLARTLFHDRRCNQMQVVVGPEGNGQYVAREVATEFHENGTSGAVSNLSLVIAKRLGPRQFLISDEDGAQLQGKGVGVVDDLVEKGGTFRALTQEIERHGGRIMVYAAWVDRSGEPRTELFDRPLVCLEHYPTRSWTKEECAENPEGLCYRKVPVNIDYGHGQEFLDGKL